MAVDKKLIQSFNMSDRTDPNVNYYEVEHTDYYRKNHPYALMKERGKSSVTLKCKLPDKKTFSKMFLYLNDCSTTGRREADIFVNGMQVLKNHLTAIAAFGPDWLEFPADQLTLEDEGVCVVKIQLGEDSPGVYWLSDAAIYVE